MTITLEQIDATTYQPVEAVNITSLLTELDHMGGTNLIGIFPTGTWKSGDQTPVGIWDLDTTISIFSQSQLLLLQKHPETPGFSEKPATSLTDEDKALLETQAHTSVTNDAGVHVIRLVTPIAPQPSNAAPLIARIGEFTQFLKTARNTGNPISVMNTELPALSGESVQQEAPVVIPVEVPVEEVPAQEEVPIEG